LATLRTAPTLADVQEARQRLLGIAEETPIYLSETFSRRCGREVQLKAENLQRTGSFKVRGAVNKLSTLSAEERAAGVVAASAGNHGQAVADVPELRRLLDEVQKRELDPLTAVREIMEKVFHLGDATDGTNTR